MTPISPQSCVVQASGHGRWQTFGVVFTTGDVDIRLLTPLLPFELRPSSALCRCDSFAGSSRELASRTSARFACTTQSVDCTIQLVAFSFQLR
jgi:hypothetical protein